MSTNWNSTPSQSLVTPEDQTGILNVLGWFLIVLVVLTVVTRLCIKWKVSRNFVVDDFFILISAVFAILSQAVVSIGVTGGLGLIKPESDFPNYERAEKAIYAANILTILSHAFSRLSVAFLIRDLTPIIKYHKATIGIAILTLIWTICAFFLLVFQCHVPDPWNSVDNTCSQRYKLFIPIFMLGTITDLTLIVLPIVMIRNLQLALRKKGIIIACFGSRIIVIVGLSLQLMYLYDYRDQLNPFVAPAYIICMLIMQCAGIISACVPYLKPFFDGLSTGILRSDNIRRKHGRSVMMSNSGGNPQRWNTTASFAVQQRTHELLHISKAPQLNSAKVEARKMGDADDEWGGEGGSQSSQAHIIRETRTWEVTNTEGDGTTTLR